MADYVTIAANSADGGEAVIGVVRIADRADLAGQQGQIGRRGRQVQLELGLDPSKVARLADTQLD